MCALAGIEFHAVSGKSHPLYRAIFYGVQAFLEGMLAALYRMHYMANALYGIY